MVRSAKPVVFLLLFLGALSWGFSQIPLTTKDLDQFTWRSIGPWNFSGRITNFAVPAGQSQAYYVLTSTGGLWKTEDGGIHFEPLFDKYGNMSMGFLAIAPGNPKVLYLGTGESLHARAAYHGNGMWKSTDEGKTWTHIGLEKSFFIPKVEVDPRNPDVVYVAAEGKLYDNSMDCERGLYKSTDGGKTWQLSLDLKDRGVVDMVMDPANPDVLIAAAYKTFRRAWTYLDRQKDNDLYKTTDGGKTWKKLTNGLPLEAETGRNGLAVYAKNPKIVYARIDEELNLGLSEREGAYEFRQGGVFRDGFYYNKFKDYKIDPELAKLVKFTPLTADTEKDLAKKLNDLAKDRDFQKTIGVDLVRLNAAARKVYKKDKDIMNSIAEAERTIKGEDAYRALVKKVNNLLVLALLADSPGVEVKDTVVVKEPDKARINPAFKDLLTFDPKVAKDEKEFISKLDQLSKDPDLAPRLKMDAGKVFSKARDVYKDKKDIAEKLKASDDLAKEYQDYSGRTVTLNRYVLEILYGGALDIMEPIKKAGVIYRSDDQGETWKKMTEYKRSGGSDVVNQVEAGYNGRLIIDPNNDQILYAHETQTTWSKDGGKTFKFTTWEGNHKAHVDSRAVWVDPLNSLHILNANDGGVSETWDGGKHFSQKETISAQQFYDISVDNARPYNVMGGTQDNGCWLGPSQNRNPDGVFPADWTYLPSGDGFFTVRDWWNPEYIYWESQFGFSNRMNFKTGEMTSLSRRNTDEENAAGKPVQRYQWNAPINLSPHNPGIVFVCSQYVHRSLSHGDKDTWQTVSPDLSKNIKERIDLSKKTNLQYGTVFSFAESIKKPGLYWAGTDDGNLQMSPDFGTTWVNITAKFYDDKGKPKKDIKGALIPYDRWVKRVLPSRFDEKTCYVAFSGYRTHNEDKTYVFVTHDLGNTWGDISQNMMNPVSDIEEDPDNANVLYLATDYGLFVTMDKGQHWLNMSSSAPQVIIKDLAIQPRDRELAIATYGRGIYIADISPFKEFKDETFKKAAILFDPKEAIQWNRLDRRGQTLGEFASADNPSLGTTLYYYLKDKADKVVLTIKDLQGQLIQELNGKTEAGLQKMTWNLNKKYDEEKMRDLRREERMKLIRLEPGRYRVTLTVNGKDVETKDLVVSPDPAYAPGED